MRARIAAALGFAAGLMAAPAFAQPATTTTRGVHPVPPAASTANPAPNGSAPAPSAPATPTHTVHHTMHHTMHTSMMHHPTAMHHATAMHHGMMHAAAPSKGAAEHMTIEQLNNMSLQAAKQGRNFTPPAGK